MVNRIWYASENFIEDLEIKLRLWDPDLVECSQSKFTEFEEGLYYLDYDFVKHGTWVGIIYENRTKMTFITFDVQGDE